MKRQYRLLLPAPILVFLSICSLLTAGESLADDVPDSLNDFIVQAADSSAGDTSIYTLTFTLARRVFFRLDGGQLIFRFPFGFNLQLIENVEIVDNRPCFDYDVSRFEVSGPQITLHVKRIHPWGGSAESEDETDKAPDVLASHGRPVHVIVRLMYVGNPTVAGTYTVDGWAITRHHNQVVKVTTSYPFHIVPGPLHTLRVFPEADTTVRVGDSIALLAHGEDRFGNAIADLPVEWSLSEGSDSIGVFSGQFFVFTTMGQGRLLATVGVIEALSGLITVPPEILLSYESNSLTPTTVSPLDTVSFQFAVELGNDFALPVLRDSSRFVVRGTSYLGSAPLIFFGDSVRPGRNLIRTGDFVIPPDESGGCLEVEARIALRVPGNGP
ncbi:MAG: hypothetical protein AB1744_01115, partial [Candidatus Zixiibacteriota bacterium]